MICKLTDQIFDQICPGSKVKSLVIYAGYAIFTHNLQMNGQRSMSLVSKSHFYLYNSSFERETVIVHKPLISDLIFKWKHY